MLGARRSEAYAGTHHSTMKMCLQLCAEGQKDLPARGHRENVSGMAFSHRLHDRAAQQHGRSARLRQRFHARNVFRDQHQQRGELCLASPHVLGAAPRMCILYYILLKKTNLCKKRCTTKERSRHPPAPSANPRRARPPRAPTLPPPPTVRGAAAGSLRTRPASTARG